MTEHDNIMQIIIASLDCISFSSQITLKLIKIQNRVRTDPVSTLSSKAEPSPAIFLDPGSRKVRDRVD